MMVGKAWRLARTRRRRAAWAAEAVSVVRLAAVIAPATGGAKWLTSPMMVLRQALAPCFQLFQEPLHLCPCHFRTAWIHAGPSRRVHAHRPSACRRLLGSAWIDLKWQGSQCRGLLEQGASAWRRTIIVEVSQFAPPVTGAITSASRTTETASAALAARLRRVVAKRHALPTINLGSLLKPENVPPAGLCWTSAPCRMVLI